MSGQSLNKEKKDIKTLFGCRYVTCVWPLFGYDDKLTSVFYRCM